MKIFTVHHSFIGLGGCKLSHFFNKYKVFLKMPSKLIHYIVNIQKYKYSRPHWNINHKF